MITKKEFIEALWEEGIQPDKGEWIYNNLEPNWKPTKEHLEALWNIIPNTVNNEKDVDIITNLTCLYEQLKAL